MTWNYANSKVKTATIERVKKVDTIVAIIILDLTVKFASREPFASLSINTLSPALQTALLTTPTEYPSDSPLSSSSRLTVKSVLSTPTLTAPLQDSMTSASAQRFYSASASLTPPKLPPSTDRERLTFVFSLEIAGRKTLSAKLMGES
jgi:hypothetical protein